MKLVIQIPCFNEAEFLPGTLAELPRRVAGFDEVEWLVVNDGSTDATVETARRCGVDHVVSFKRNLGLSRAYVAGLKASLRLGADVIVNTDADNQYCAADIPALVGPILAGKADIVIGTRPISTIKHFSLLKKALQGLGSAIVRSVSGTTVQDAPSGFRAVSREAAMQLHVFNEYTYTLETIIQAGQKNMTVVCVPVRVNRDMRPSRLVKSIPRYVRKSIFTMLRIFVVYRPFRFFMAVGGAIFGAGFLLGLRFLVFILLGSGGAGHVQSLILASILLGIGFQTMLTAFLADLLAVNRTLLEDIEFRAWKNEDRTGRAHPDVKLRRPPRKRPKTRENPRGA
jgi:glycosyltransferase involved in cell wall biosynthesis